MERFDLFVIMLLIYLFMFDFLYLGIIILSSYIGSILVKLLSKLIKEYRKIK